MNQGTQPSVGWRVRACWHTVEGGVFLALWSSGVRGVGGLMQAGMPAPCCVLPLLPTRPGCMWWRLSSPDMTTDSQWRRCSGSQGGAECQRRVVSLTHVGAEDVVWFKGSH